MAFSDRSHRPLLSRFDSSSTQLHPSRTRLYISSMIPQLESVPFSTPVPHYPRPELLPWSRYAALNFDTFLRSIYPYVPYNFRIVFNFWFIWPKNIRIEIKNFQNIEIFCGLLKYSIRKIICINVNIFFSLFFNVQFEIYVVELLSHKKVIILLTENTLIVILEK